ncbi:MULTISPECIES: hypothetical protein [unclassified Clostridioides]|uniref:hypothetical protein n=1 Tax=unclassified Clostridioides TaxID=2635829 RepID=UPI001D11F7A9|nr:hypothetical protein [Clostridioides sp. ES-S-0049-03]MCC0672696.1 hypothetical protein [Clostridioides sp. ES-S-0145-01]MCC0675372.1 hypothetical protein [Clostridioides sp. ES-W-0018-02]MCC0709819.1 hypothetical protein [Clostridioides sp. ES-W-0017-02]UDN60675.1 hypothetical protein IC758_12500 [Clostridioides sp. ES-W-0016-02]
MDKSIKEENILSYNPNLEVGRFENFEYTSIVNEPITIEDYKTNILKSFEKYHPSKVVSKLNELISLIKSYLSLIENDAYQGKITKQYCFSITESEQYILKEENFKNLYGDSKFESYLEILNIKNELLNIRKIFVMGIYTTKKNDYLFDDIDSSFINKLNQYEYEKSNHNINYFSLFYDIQVTFILLEYCKKIEKIIKELYLIENRKKGQPINSETHFILNKKFNLINKTMKNDLFNEKSIHGNIEDSLHNLFLAKHDVNTFINNFINLRDEFNLLNEIKEDNLNDVEICIDELINACMMSVIYKKDVYNSLLNKSKIREFFTK